MVPIMVRSPEWMRISAFGSGGRKEPVSDHGLGREPWKPSCVSDMIKMRVFMVGRVAMVKEALVDFGVRIDMLE